MNLIAAVGVIMTFGEVSTRKARDDACDSEIVQIPPLFVHADRLESMLSKGTSNNLMGTQLNN